MTTKNIFRIALVCVLLVSVVTLIGCKKNETISYSITTHITTTKTRDFNLLFNYVETKGLKNSETIVGEGKDKEAADADAKAQFAKKKALLVYSEFVAMNLDSLTSFSYSLNRSADSETSGSATVTVDSWEYPGN